MTQKVETLSPMQQALLDRADAIFASIGETVNKAGDLAWRAGEAVGKEIPDVAYQYVAFGRAIETLQMSIAVVTFIFSVWALIRVSLFNSYKLPSDSYDATPHGVRIIAGIFGAVGCMAAFTAIVSNLRDFAMVWFAPKVWLILEMVNLIKMIKS